MSAPSWLAPSAGAAAHASLQASWLDPPPGPDSGCERKQPRVHGAVKAAQAAAAAAEAAAQATIAAQALLAEVRSRQGPSRAPTPVTRRKTRAQRDDPSSSTKAAAKRVRSGGCTVGFAKPPAAHETLGSDSQRSALDGHEESSSEGEADRTAESNSQDQPLPGKVSEHGAAGTRPYRKRGTAGTLQGKRPPKDPEKLQAFMRAKAAFEKEKAELQAQQTSKKKFRRHTPTQQSYWAWQRTFDRSQSASSRVAFVAAAAEWQTEKARQMAEALAL